MSYADKVFINMCRDIIDNGTDTRGEKVRPVWEDGTPAYTIKKFGVVNRYDLSKEFPALTLRRTAIKSCTDELLRIWRMGRRSSRRHARVLRCLEIRWDLRIRGLSHGIVWRAVRCASGRSKTARFRRGILRESAGKMDRRRR